MKILAFMKKGSKQININNIILQENEKFVIFLIENHGKILVSN